MRFTTARTKLFTAEKSACKSASPFAHSSARARSSDGIPIELSSSLYSFGDTFVSALRKEETDAKSSESIVPVAMRMHFLMNSSLNTKCHSLMQYSS